MQTQTLITTLEELGLNAWPPVQTLHCEGWMLGFSGGFTRRANSVQPLYASLTTMPLEAKISLCESLYARRRLPTVFKMTAAAQPADLDTVLAARGYTQTALTSVQTVALDTAQLPNWTRAAVVTETLHEDWISDYCRFNDHTAHLSTVRQMLARIAVASVYVSIKQADTTIAVGMGVLERGYIGLFGLVVDKTCRGQGIGTELVAHLLAWGREHSAQHAYLQVMRDNHPALRLYAKFGFQEQYTYWYRTKT